MNLKSFFSQVMKWPESIAEEVEKKIQEGEQPDLKQTRLWKASLEAGIKQEEKPLAVLSFDTDKIKEYVFASPKLPEIRGGSKLIEDGLNKNAIAGILKNFDLSEDNIVYASGGGGILILPVEKAESVGKTIERHFVKCTLGATVSWDFVKIHPMELVYGYRCLDMAFEETKTLITKNPDLQKYFGIENDESLTPTKWQKRKCFGEIVTVLAAGLQKRKGERESYPFFETIPYAQRCKSCGMRAMGPIPSRFENWDGEKELCTVCWKKIKEGKDDKRANWEAEDLKTIGNAGKGRAKGYVGVIYADGNGMGRVLQELKTIHEYHNWSESVSQIFKGIGPWMDKKLGIKQEYKYKYEQLVTGGDDIIIFLPAERTLDIAEKLILKIEKELQAIKATPEALRRKMGLSAGIVIAHHNYPALYLVDYAEQLLENAKKRGKRNLEAPESAVDFAILNDSSPISEEISILRKEMYEREEKQGARTTKLRLTSKPFTLDEFREFLKYAGTLKHVSQSQVYLIRSFVQNHPKAVSEINFLYQVVRSGKDKSWKKWIKEIKESTGNDWNSQGNLRNLLWREMVDEKDRTFSTQFLDYTEVYHFLGKGEPS